MTAGERYGKWPLDIDVHRWAMDYPSKNSRRIEGQDRGGKGQPRRPIAQGWASQQRQGAEPRAPQVP